MMRLDITEEGDSGRAASSPYLKPPGDRTPLVRVEDSCRALQSILLSLSSKERRFPSGSRPN